MILHLLTKYHPISQFAILTGGTAVTIERFDIHMAPVTELVEIWTGDGYPDWPNTNSMTKIWEGMITGQGQGVATPLPAFDPPIELAENSILGVYATVEDYQGNNMYHSDGVQENTVYASDSYISLAEGISQWHLHQNFEWPTRWNGVVYYSIPGQTTSPTTLAPSSLAPTISPSISPTSKPTPNVSYSVCLV